MRNDEPVLREMSPLILFTIYINFSGITVDMPTVNHLYEFKLIPYIRLSIFQNFHSYASDAVWKI